MKYLTSTCFLILMFTFSSIAQRHIDLGITLLNPAENAVITPFERVNIEIELSNEGADTIFAGDTIWFNHSQIPMISQKWFILTGDIPPNATANLIIDSFSNSDTEVGSQVDFCVTLYSPDNVFGLSGYTYVDTISANNTDCNTITLNSTSVNELQQNVNNLKLYPNPAQDIFYIEGRLAYMGTINVSVADITGRVLMQRSFDKKDKEAMLKLPLDIHTLPNGIYFINASAGGNTAASKLIKQ